MVETFTRNVDGFTCYGLRNEAVEVVVVPELGAKLLSLRNRQSGREWMWTPPDGGALFRNRLGDLFDDSTKIGADECIPTIMPCRWQGRDLADHGEAWTEAWTLDEDAFAAGRIVTALQLPVSPLFFERSLLLNGATVQLDYRVTNLAADATDYLWAFHPLMAIHDGDRIVLPADLPTLILDSAEGLPWRERGLEIAWPNPSSAVALDRLDLGGEDRCIKLFSPPLKTGRAVIVNERTGDAVHFSFDAAQLNTLGIWINRGAWNGYHHVALEPGNGAPDPLDVAVRDWQRFARLDPGANHAWRVEMRLGIGD